ncbi:MAG: LamG domain-containing protein [Candidatus Sumerlaeota bacterium]|nr:LamG domain-containing protein [Candidatus Sumerlaeota bacterium]
MMMSNSTHATEPLKVNTCDLDLALSAGIHCMSTILNPDDRNIPYFGCMVFDTPRLEFHHQLSVGNVTGRALFAMLKAEHALGARLDEDVIKKYRRVLFDSYAIVRGIPANPDRPGAPYTTCWIFNDGAGFRGLAGLALSRNDQMAAEYLHDSIANHMKYFVGTGFNWRAYQEHFAIKGGGTYNPPRWDEPNNDTGTFPFVIWPLVQYYKAANYKPALDLATTLAESLMIYGFPPDGGAAGHDHGFELIAGMNALAEVALLTSNSVMMDRVRARYDSGLTGIISRATGWVPERVSAHSDVGEINNTAELIETAMRLGDWGWPQYYQDAERFTRAHLLPAQLLDTSFIPPSPDRPQSDGRANVRERVRGAYGFPAPYGHVSTKNPYLDGGFMMDIVGGGVATVAEVKLNCCRRVNGGHYVNLLFDCDNDDIRVASPYPDRGPLTVTLKKEGDLHVRLSDWVDRKCVKVICGKDALPFAFTPYYVVIGKPPVGRPISVEFPLPVRGTSEVINGRMLDVKFKGDAVVAMSQMGTKLPFFPDFSLCESWLESLGPDRVITSAEFNGNGAPTTGTLLGEKDTATTAGRAGGPSKALAFNGRSSSLMYGVRYFPMEQFTLGIWFKPEGATPDYLGVRQIFSAWARPHDDPLRLSLSGDELYASIENGGIHKTKSFRIEAGKWHHAVVVKDGAKLLLYLDGELKDKTSAPAHMDTLACDFGIGFNPHFVGGEYFLGVIGDFTLYGRALNADEILSVFHTDQHK